MKNKNTCIWWGCQGFLQFSLPVKSQFPIFRKTKRQCQPHPTSPPSSNAGPPPARQSGPMRNRLSPSFAGCWVWSRRSPRRPTKRRMLMFLKRRSRRRAAAAILSTATNEAASCSKPSRAPTPILQAWEERRAQHRTLLRLGQGVRALRAFPRLADQPHPTGRSGAVGRARAPAHGMDRPALTQPEPPQRQGHPADQLARSLEGRHEPEVEARFLMRTLFNMFAETRRSAGGRDTGTPRAAQGPARRGGSRGPHPLAQARVSVARRA